METMTALPSISLYYKEGTSDKEYHLSITGNDEKGYQVEYRYGRRGAKLTSKFKNKMPTDFATAQGIYDHNVKAQLKDGYTTGESGTPYIGTESAGKLAGLYPQLLNFVGEDEVQKYLDDDKWVIQEKKNGVRCMIRKVGKTAEGINKKGFLTSIPETVSKAVCEACGIVGAVIDGELIGETYWLFDLLSIGVHSFTDKTYRERLTNIHEWFDDVFVGCFQFVPTAVGKASKKALFAKLKEDNAEGVVFSNLDSPYKAGRPASGGNRVKFKFFATATVRVRAMNDKSSVQMEMLKKGEWVYVGDCTYYPTIYTPKPGDFIEVRYLYAFPSGSLYGPPVLLNKRTDCDEGDCLLSQLKYKQGSVDEDDDA